MICVSLPSIALYELLFKFNVSPKKGIFSHFGASIDKDGTSVLDITKISKAHLEYESTFLLNESETEFVTKCAKEWLQLVENQSGEETKELKPAKD